MQRIHTGQLAPGFELPDQNGAAVTLSQFRGVSPVVLFFYPKDDTSGCTKEACGFRDRVAEFSEKGAEILGISSDSSESHRGFASKYNLPFRLLSDPGGRVRRLYGVRHTWGIIPGRATYVIDREGLVRHIFVSQSKAERHIDEALLGLKNLCCVLKDRQ